MARGVGGLHALPRVAQGLASKVSACCQGLYGYGTNLIPYSTIVLSGALQRCVAEAVVPMV